MIMWKREGDTRTRDDVGIMSDGGRGPIKARSGDSEKRQTLKHPRLYSDGNLSYLVSILTPASPMSFPLSSTELVGSPLGTILVLPVDPP